MKNCYLNNLKKMQLFFFILMLIILPISESIKQICFGIVLILFVLNRFIERKIVTDFLSTGLFIYFIGSLLSLSFSSSFILGFKWSYNIFMILALYLVLINDFKSDYYNELIRKGFFIGLLIGLVWGIFIWKLYLTNPRLEIHSIGAPNSTGTFLGISLLFLISYLFQKKSEIFKNKEVIFYFILLLLLIIAVILNGSRGMYIGLAFSLFFLFFAFGSKNKIFGLLILFLFLSLLIGILVYPELKNRILDPNSLYDRFNNWYRNLQCFKINPITGAGANICYLDPDNLFIAILSKTGIIGLIGFFVMIYLYLKQFNYNKLIITLLIYLLVNGIFETTFKHEPAIIFMLVSHFIGYEKSFNS